MRTLVILNPAAGGGIDPRELQARLARRIEADFQPTSGPGDAIELAEDAARSGYARVIAAGGDGTVREVATGLFRGGGDAGLGIIPTGTGNDLAFSLRLPFGIEEAAVVAAGVKTTSLDLIRAVSADPAESDLYLTNAAVAGFCGRIGDSMSPRFRRRWRLVAYPLAALRQLRDLRPYSVEILVDGRSIETKALMVIAANSMYAGGRVPLAPGARSDDGQLDLVIIHAVSPPRLATLIPRVLLGRHAGHPGVSIHRASDVLLEADPPMWINLDGDTWMAGSASFHIIPAALQVAVL
jgi:diacylglycerol kinase (ATP)